MLSAWNTYLCVRTLICLCKNMHPDCSEVRKNFEFYLDKSHVLSNLLHNSVDTLTECVVPSEGLFPKMSRRTDFNIWPRQIVSLA